MRDKRHRIVFYYTPKHASWLNQIEIWFSILMRKLLSRSRFCARHDLKTRIEKFIKYYNTKLAKPFKWTMTGKPPMA
ncbi:MAG: transposase [Magnetovibrio sp.]|nr:transposase [Magnetovibrio sp.]